MGADDLDFFKDKTVLVTGDSGFKGCWMSLMLKRLGADVIGYSLDPPTDPSLFEIVNLENIIEHHRGDVRDLPNLKRVLSGSAIDVVFHMAAQPIVRASYADPLETMETNIMGTVNVLEAVRANGSVRACICITSDKCYENREWEFPYRENDALGGEDPYSASKGAAEIVIASYARSIFQRGKGGRTVVSSVRAGNVIGGGDWASDRLVPDCARALSEGRQIEIRNPDSIRPWQFVLEPLYGYLLLGAKASTEGEDYAGPWNFGPTMGSNANVAKIVKMMIKSWGGGSWKTVEQHSAVHEASVLRLDSTKARNRLGWRSRYSLTKTIDTVVSWYKAYYSGRNDMKHFTDEQIIEYLRELVNSKEEEPVE